MAKQADSIAEVDLWAYVDGQLDVGRRIEVEDYLSRHPEAAAALMADLKNRDTMRLVLGDRRSPRADALEMARQLDRKLVARQLKRMLPRVSFGALILLCVWLGQDEIGEMLVTTSQAAIPSFANEAFETYTTARVRNTMTSEVKSATLDRAAIKRATRIIFPQPSGDWRVLDTRLVPSDEGPGLEISLDAGRGDPLTFFAVQTRDHAPSLPIAIEMGGAAVAYWRKGDFGYALAGNLSAVELDQIATDFADNPVD
jgi:anti-sigma factor RsiW